MNNLPDNVLITNDVGSTLDRVLQELSPDKIHILVDENTEKHCLPIIHQIGEFSFSQILSGESNKNIDTCAAIWKDMTNNNLTRNSLLINLGGGVIGDMGGFAASTYKRGIRFVNIPTTLLSMVDASVGGKLGIDFMGLKNHIGLFKNPENVIISDVFLNSLPSNEKISGWAEVLKHGLISDKSYWEESKKMNPNKNSNLNYVIEKSVQLKGEIVTNDPEEKGLRKILNFGHTTGHAIESWNISKGNPITHGECVAAGMILESHISNQKGLVSEADLSDIAISIKNLYLPVSFPDLSNLISLMKQDKKNTDSNISFSLLKRIGECIFDQPVTKDELEQAVRFYSDLYE
jgi:3-dehydroquinate synthase